MESNCQNPGNTLSGKRCVSLDARLSTAMELIGSCDTFADIGCDHGRLVCAMLQHNFARKVIASDLSAPSLEKAKHLAEHIGLSAQVDFRTGSGLQVLVPYEADAVAILGMGGKLIADILDDCPIPLMGAKKAVLQPMRGVEELRSYLWEKGYRVENDRVIRDAGRYYQIFSVLPPDDTIGRDSLPPGFPADCFTVGYRAFAQRNADFDTLVYREWNQCRKSLRQAGGTSGEEHLMRKGKQLEQLFRLLDGDNTSV